MTFYAITQKGEEDFIPPVFYAGQEEGEEAISIFTSEEKAQQFITAAGWEETDEVAEFEALDVLHWMLEAYEQGATYLVVDPNHEQLQNQEQTVIVLEEELDQLTEMLTNDLLSGR